MARGSTQRIGRPLRAYVDTSVFGGHAPYMELLENTPEMVRLAEAYLAARVVRRTARVDALHVATASVARADVLVSWNFHDIVQLWRIRGFHAVNVANGYPLIEIRSPIEVIYEA